MAKEKGYEKTEDDIMATIRYLRTNGEPNATREEAIEFLEGMQATAHLAAHKIVEDLEAGKLKRNKNN